MDHAAFEYERGFRGCGLRNAAAELPAGDPGRAAVASQKEEAERLIREAPAEALAPPVTEALELLRRTPGVLAAVMSGSGATCVGVTKDAGVARNAARIIQLARQGWWVAPAPVLAA